MNLTRSSAGNFLWLMSSALLLPYVRVSPCNVNNDLVWYSGRIIQLQRHVELCLTIRASLSPDVVLNH